MQQTDVTEPEGVNPEPVTPAPATPAPEVTATPPESPAHDPPNPHVAQPPQLLDPRAVTLWRWEAALACALPCLGLVIGGTLLWVLTPVWKIAIVAGWSAGLIFSLASVFWWPRRAYQRWSYTLAETTLELSYGVVWRVSVLIPLSRIQHVDRHRNPFERRLGLATLVVHTAGTRDASHRIPGLTASIADELRDQLAATNNVRVS